MPFYPFFGEGSPTKIDYRKNKGYPYSNLSTGGPRSILKQDTNETPAFRVLSEGDLLVAALGDRLRHAAAPHRRRVGQ